MSAKESAMGVLEQLPIKMAAYRVDGIRLFYHDTKGLWSVTIEYALTQRREAIHWDLSTAIHLLKDQMEEEYGDLWDE